MNIKPTLKQLSSLILPVTVLILVPLWIEKDISIKNNFAFAAGILVILTGLTVMIVTISSFVTIGKGTLAPWFPTGKLVVTGLHAYVRNPMIIGVLTVLLGESAAILSRPILVWLILFFLINNLYFLLFEEPNLERRFGKDYLDYKKKVPRWIPNLKQYKPLKKLSRNKAKSI